MTQPKYPELVDETIGDKAILLLNWFAQYMTQPKYPDLVDETRESRKATIIRNTLGAIKPFYNGESN